LTAIKSGLAEADSKHDAVLDRFKEIEEEIK